MIDSLATAVTGRSTPEPARLIYARGVGLDWEPLAIPKRGYEREFVDLFHKLARAPAGRREQIQTWFANVAEPPFAVIGAPRIGYDPETEPWLRTRATRANRLAELDEIRAEMKGFHVLDLLPPCDGFPVYSRCKEVDDLERYAFHAELLVDYSDVLGTELFERAFTSMLRDAHVEYAARLTDVANRFWLDNGLPDHVATTREPVYAVGSLERKGHILYAAAKWCTYWSERGHGLAVAIS